MESVIASGMVTIAILGWLLLMTASLGCAAKAIPPAPIAAAEEPVPIQSPSREVEVIYLPRWVDDDVKLCVEEPRWRANICVTLGNLRADFFQRLRARRRE